MVVGLPGYKVASTAPEQKSSKVLLLKVIVYEIYGTGVGGYSNSRNTRKGKTSSYARYKIMHFMYAYLC